MFIFIIVFSDCGIVRIDPNARCYSNCQRKVLRIARSHSGHRQICIELGCDIQFLQTWDLFLWISNLKYCILCQDYLHYSLTTLKKAL